MQRVFDINPTIDVAAASTIFAHDDRVQIRDFLTDKTAQGVRRVLERETLWGTAWQAGTNGPSSIRQHELRAMPSDRRTALALAVNTAAAAREYAFRFAHYPMVHAYIEKWNSKGIHDLLVEHLNDAPFLDLARAVTGIPELIKADAQATFFSAGDFLSVHDDSHATERRRVAYVLNVADADWSPDWGGYLNFLDDDGDIVAGWRPRFNSLNLFRVPQRHQVSYVPPFARASRFAVTGWFRDK
jgi:Rps23 Pro-64 3,4-dihydroxylase Tpa1-like proline 4-hydroxylase